MTIINFMRTFVVVALAALVFTACSKEEVLPEENQDAAFSSNNGCQVFSGDIEVDKSDFDYVTDKIYGNVVGITEGQDDNGKFFKLGFIVTENSQNPGEVWALVNANTNTWRRLNECRTNNIAGFWDALSKNNSEDARIIQQGTSKTGIFLFYGNNGRNVQRFWVDKGEVLKANGRGFTLPGGFNAGGLFFHNSNRADFPANWLGVKGKKLWNFGPSLNGTPSLIPVRNGGFGGADLNKEIRRIQGYWPFNNQRIVLERTNGTTITVQKERKNGVNFYKK